MSGTLSVVGNVVINGSATEMITQEVVMQPSSHLWLGAGLESLRMVLRQASMEVTARGYLRGGIMEFLELSSRVFGEGTKTASSLVVAGGSTANFDEASITVSGDVVVNDGGGVNVDAGEFILVEGNIVSSGGMSVGGSGRVFASGLGIIDGVVSVTESTLLQISGNVTCVRSTIEASSASFVALGSLNETACVLRSSGMSNFAPTEASGVIGTTGANPVPAVVVVGSLEGTSLRVSLESSDGGVITFNGDVELEDSTVVISGGTVVFSSLSLLRSSVTVSGDGTLQTGSLRDLLGSFIRIAQGGSIVVLGDCVFEASTQMVVEADAVIDGPPSNVGMDVTGNMTFAGFLSTVFRIVAAKRSWLRDVIVPNPSPLNPVGAVGTLSNVVVSYGDQIGTFESISGNVQDVCFAAVSGEDTYSSTALTVSVDVVYEAGRADCGSGGQGGLPVGAIAGIVVGSALIVGVLFFLLVKWLRNRELLRKKRAFHEKQAKKAGLRPESTESYGRSSGKSVSTDESGEVKTQFKTSAIEL